MLLLFLVGALSWKLYIFLPSGTLLTSADILTTTVECNRAASTDVVADRPDKLEWDDPDHPGKVCQTTGIIQRFLSGVPAGKGYILRLSALSSVPIESPQSDPVKVDLLWPLPAPTGLRAVR